MAASGISRKWEECDHGKSYRLPSVGLVHPAPFSLLLFTSGEASHLENHRDRGTNIKLKLATEWICLTAKIWSVFSCRPVTLESGFTQLYSLGFEQYPILRPRYLTKILNKIIAYCRGQQTFL